MEMSLFDCHLVDPQFFISVGQLEFFIFESQKSPSICVQLLHLGLDGLGENLVDGLQFLVLFVDDLFRLQFGLVVKGSSGCFLDHA